MSGDLLSTAITHVSQLPDGTRHRQSPPKDTRSSPIPCQTNPQESRIKPRPVRSRALPSPDSIPPPTRLYTHLYQSPTLIYTHHRLPPHGDATSLSAIPSACSRASASGPATSASTFRGPRHCEHGQEGTYRSCPSPTATRPAARSPKGSHTIFLHRDRDAVRNMLLCSSPRTC